MKHTDLDVVIHILMISFFSLCIQTLFWKIFPAGLYKQNRQRLRRTIEKSRKGGFADGYKKGLQAGIKAQELPYR